MAAQKNTGSPLALAETTDLNILGEALASDIEKSIQEALTAGVVFPHGCDSLTIFRNALADSIRDIERHERGLLLQRFLLDGPWEDGGEIPPDEAWKRLRR